jgi:hypothetical protein
MVAVLVSCSRNGAQQPGNMSLSAPLDKIERVSFDLMPNDLPTDGKALQARTTAIRAELSAMSKVADPRKYGLKQIELAYAIRAKRVNATDALMQSGLQATDEASLIFSREKDPLIWAQVRALRASLFSMTELFGMSSNQSGGMSPPAGQSPLEDAQREAGQALQVFTRNDYPLQYLEVMCDLSAAQTQKALVKEGAEKTRDNIRTTSYGTVVTNAQIPFCLPLVLGGGWTPAVQNVVSSPTLMALTSMGTGANLVIAAVVGRLGAQRE